MANTITVTLTQVGPSGREARVRDPAVLIDRPTAKGGDDRGPMGGERLLAALRGCFTSTLSAAIAAREAAIDAARVEVVGVLEEAPPRFSAVRMVVRAAGGAALLERLVSIAERGCTVADTLRGAVALTVESEATTA